MSNKDSAFIEQICILVQDHSGKVKACFANANATTIAAVRDILRDPNKINALKWKNDAGEERDLTTVFKQRLRQLESYINYSQNRWGPIYEGMVDMSGLDSDDLDTFISFGLGEVKYDEAKAIAASQRRNNPIIPKGSPLDLWNKHTVPKSDDFPYWKKAHEWTKFCSKFKMVAEVQNLARVLNASYYPSTLEDSQLFQKQCAFIYCVLDGHVTFGPAATIIKRYETAQYNGQEAWDAIITEFSDNMYGELRKEQLYKLLTSVIIPEQHAKPYQQYVTEFQEWYREYNELADVATAMSSQTFLHNFERFITEVPGITGIKHQLRQQKFSNKKLGVTAAPITPEQEVEFLIDYLIQMDNQNLVNQTTSRELKKRYNVDRVSANMTQLETSAFDDFNIGDYYDSVQVQDDEYLVNSSASDYGEQDGRLPEDCFKNLSTEGKKNWRKFTLMDRKVLIKGIIDAVLEELSADDDEKPSHSNHLRSGMKRPVARNARVNAANLVRVQDLEDAETRQVTMASQVPVTPVEVTAMTGMLSAARGERVPADKIDELPPTDFRRQLKDHVPVLAHKHPADPTRLMSPKNTAPDRRVRLPKKQEVPIQTKEEEQFRQKIGEQSQQKIGEQPLKENGEHITQLLKSRLSRSKIDRLKRRFNL